MQNEYLFFDCEAAGFPIRGWFFLLTGPRLFGFGLSADGSTGCAGKTGLLRLT